MNLFRIAVALLVSAGVPACVDLPKLSLVSEMDIFGSRVEVIGDQTRATPRPGESANFALSVIYPELKARNDEFSMAVLECTWPDRYLSVPVCQEFIAGLEALNGDAGVDAGMPRSNPIAGLQQAFACTDNAEVPLGPMTLRCVLGRPDFDFTVAKDVTGERRLFLGIVCRNGNPVLTGGDGLPSFDCTPRSAAKGKLESESFYGSATIAYKAAEENRNPEGEPAIVELNDEAWPMYSGSTAPTETDCDKTNKELPEVEAGTEYTLRIAYKPSAREKVDGEVETLRISHRATAGDFERGASYIPATRKPAEDGNLEVETTWTAPSVEDKGRRMIHFFFGIRDGRGGFGSAERYACRPLAK